MNISSAGCWLQIYNHLPYFFDLIRHHYYALLGFEDLAKEDPSLNCPEQDSVLSVDAKTNHAFPLSPETPNPPDETSKDKSNISCELSNRSIAMQSNDLGLTHEPSGSQQPSQMFTGSTSPTTKNIILERQQQLDNEELNQGEDPPTAIEDYVSLELSIMELTKKISKVGTAHLKGKALKEAARFKKEVKLLDDKVKLVQASYAFDQKKAGESVIGFVIHSICFISAHLLLSITQTWP